MKGCISGGFSARVPPRQDYTSCNTRFLCRFAQPIIKSEVFPVSSHYFFADVSYTFCISPCIHSVYTGFFTTFSISVISYTTKNSQFVKVGQVGFEPTASSSRTRRAPPALLPEAAFKCIAFSGLYKNRVYIKPQSRRRNKERASSGSFNTAPFQTLISVQKKVHQRRWTSGSDGA